MDAIPSRYRLMTLKSLMHPPQTQALLSRIAVIAATQPSTVSMLFRLTAPIIAEYSSTSQMAFRALLPEGPLQPTATLEDQ